VKVNKYTNERNLSYMASLDDRPPHRYLGCLWHDDTDRMIDHADPDTLPPELTGGHHAERLYERDKDPFVFRHYRRLP
jgi:hypothetical protein